MSLDGAKGNKLISPDCIDYVGSGDLFAGLINSKLTGLWPSLGQDI